MDLNYVLQRHQISLMRAAQATCVEARCSHEGLARHYARMIDLDRQARDLPATARFPAHRTLNVKTGG